MTKSLLVVESPAKAKTIEKYLGKDFKVIASYGHVRDLVPKEGAVNTDNNFEMHYQVIERNSKHVEQIAKLLKNYDALYLATDPDREGEAIAWHISQLLQHKEKLKNKKYFRVVFHQITKKSVREAVDNPRDISMELVNAQQARRALDYLVGFNLSPLLWKKIRPGLSAGRVQSPALRMIVKRDNEIEAFKSQEYWTVHADCLAQKQTFSTRLIEFEQKKIEQFSITNQDDANKICDTIKKNANGQLSVIHLSKKERKRYPAAPFITSTLQQEASRKLGFTASKTMQIAQQLYEGVDIAEEGPMGLITYMRTDSVTLAEESIEEIRTFILNQYGKDLLPENKRVYKTKSKNAQEAHEAIRPTSILRKPETIKRYLNQDQLKLYTLIWKRTLASQMIEAILHTTVIDLATQGAVFRANGSIIYKPGFITIYQETLDDEPKTHKKEDDSMLPPLKEGDEVDVEKITGKQHFTEPPPRYSEASLVKTLEEHGIGRPSTYASILATLKSRDYVHFENKRFTATDVGRVVSRFLNNYFTKYVDYDFTANLEDELDAISRGEKEWVPVLKEFWSPFKHLIDVTETSVKRSDVTQEKIEEKCPECQSDLSIRLGRQGLFIGCTAYPDCRYTRNVNDEKRTNETVEGRKCPDCHSDLVIKAGRFGKFIGCSNYPDCHHIEPLEKPKDTHVLCPKCKQGNLLQRKSRRNKIFYSCERYPDCTYALWNEPVAEACPLCHWPILSIKITKSRGTEKVCPQQNCKFVEPIE